MISILKRKVSAFLLTLCFFLPGADFFAEISALAETQAQPKLFGTIEFRRPAHGLPAWEEMLARKLSDNLFSPSRKLGPERWGKIRGQALGLPLMKKLAFVNSFWNNWPYREDFANWGVEDYWEAPHEFAAHSGDCEDYSIAKYFMLKELGVPVDKMRIVVATDSVRGENHAILAVYAPDGIYILDNLSKAVLPAARIRNYRPHYSLNENGRWAHLKGRPAKEN